MDKTQGEMARELVELLPEEEVIDLDILDALATLGYKLVEAPDDEAAQDFVLGIIVEAAKHEPNAR